MKKNKNKEVERFLKLASEHNIDLEKVKKYFLLQDKIEKENQKKEENDEEGFYFPRRV